MSSAPSHTIRSQVLDVTLRERGLVHSVQETLSALSRRTLLRETDAIFSQVCDAERRLRIDQLEVDLGTLSFERLEEDFLEKFRPALWNALTAWLADQRLAPVRHEAGEQPAGTRIELLTHLLLHGSAPWWWAAPGGRSLEAIVFEALEETPEALHRLVRRLGAEALVRRRMVLQLSDAGLEALLWLLEPANAEFTIQYGRNLRREQEETKFVEATRQEFRDVTWELILQYLLVERGSEFNTKSFLRSTIRGLAQRYRLTYRALLTHLASAVVPERRLPRPRSLQVLLQTLEREDLAEPGREGSFRAEDEREGGKAQAHAEETPWLAVDPSLSGGESELWTQFADAWRARALERLPRLWAAILWFTSAARAAQMLVSRFAPAEWEGLLEALGRGEEAGVLAAVTGPFPVENFREHLWRAAFEAVSALPGSNAPWAALLRRALGKLETPEQRATVLSHLTDVRAVPSQAAFSDALQELQQSDDAASISAVALAAAVLEHFLAETPGGRAIAQAWWAYPSPWRRALWERILLAAPPSRVAQRLISLSPPAAWPAVLRSMISRDEPAELAAFEGGLRELHRAGNLGPGPWESVREKIWLAVFETAAGMAAGRPWGRRDWLALVKRFLALMGKETRATEILAALNMVPAAGRQTALAGALREAAVSAAGPGYPLELATLRVAPELAVAVLEKFAGTGAIVPPGALSLLPGGPEALLIRLATLQPAALVRLLPRLAAQPQGLSGLAARFSTAALGALVHAIAPRATSLLLSYLALIVGQRAALFAEAGQGERWRRNVWRTMLAILAAQAGAPQAASSIRAHVEEMSRRHGMPLPALATRLWRLVRGESSAGMKELARLFASLRAGRGPEDTEPADAPALLQRSAAARLALWRTFLFRASTDVALEPALRSLWTDAAHDPTAIYREELAGVPIDAGVVETIISTGGEPFFLHVVTGQSAAWRAQFREWLNFLEGLPTQLFPFARRELRSRMLLGLCELFREPPSKLLSPATVMLELLARAGVLRHVQPSDWRAAPPSQVLARVLLTASANSTRAPVPRMLQALKAAAGPLREAKPPPKKPAPRKTPEKEPAFEGPWFVDNAGLVLLAPFFPHYHKANDLLEEGRFRDAAAAERAVLLLQLLLGLERQPFEHTLVLNKVLCGLALKTPVAASLEPKESETQNAELLLRSALQNWPAAANLSLDGFRNSFLWREGKLERRESSWRVTVQTRGYDVLLGSLPWGFSTIKAPWMPEPLYVEWV